MLAAVIAVTLICSELQAQLRPLRGVRMGSAIARGNVGWRMGLRGARVFRNRYDNTTYMPATYNYGQTTYSQSVVQPTYTPTYYAQPTVVQSFALSFSGSLSAIDFMT